MTYGYSVSMHGMADQIDEAYGQSNQPLLNGAAFFLAGKIKAAVEKSLPGPARVMRWARSIAQRCSKEGRVVEWTTPTSFPCANRYHPSLYTTLNLAFGGGRIRRRSAYGFSSEINKREAVDAIAPNYVHSLDASHLIRVVNACEIPDILTVHAC